MIQKWNLQDIKPAGSKSVQKNVAVQKARQDIAPRVQKINTEEHFTDPDLASIEVMDGNHLRKRRVFITIIIAVLIIFFGFVVNVFLSGADVIIQPKYKDVTVQANFDAYKNPETGELGYELLTLEATGEKQVKATGKETVSQRSEGKIFVYNTKGTSPQRLIKNTRFETSDGLIFRIKESIEVPAIKTSSDGSVIHGSVVADVFADGTGDQYNIKPTRFTVPGLKGSDQFDSIYGESTSAFTGGFEGEKYIINEQELETAKQTLHIELRDTLLKRLTEERPAGFILYDDSVTFVFDSLPATEYGESLATIKERARLQVPMFKESQFSIFIADLTISDYSATQPVEIFDPKTLSFAYESGTTTTSDIAMDTKIEFILRGNARIVWKFNESELKAKLLGIKKIDADKIFSNYPGIGSAQAELRPFWTKVFPDSPEEINITTVIE